jgi:hypothetical protein
VPVNVVTGTSPDIDTVRVLPGKAIPTPKGGDIYEINWRRRRRTPTATEICDNVVIAHAGCLEEGGCDGCDGDVLLIQRCRAEEWWT